MRRWVLAKWMTLFAGIGCGYAQQTPADPIILHPEALAGRWEAANPTGSGTIGMNVLLTTVVEGAPKTLDGQTQRLSDIGFGLFHRTGPRLPRWDSTTLRPEPPEVRSGTDIG